LRKTASIFQLRVLKYYFKKSISTTQKFYSTNKATNFVR